MGFSRKRGGPRGVNYAAVYRDASGKVRNVGTRVVDTDGHLSRNRFTKQVRKPARERTGLPCETRMHCVAATAKYLHTLPGDGDAALAALDRVRKPTGSAR